MAEVLLTHSNHLYSDPKQVAKMQPYPPLQTILAAAVLEQHGIETALYDPTLDSPHEGFRDALSTGPVGTRHVEEQRDALFQFRAGNVCRHLTLPTECRQHKCRRLESPGLTTVSQTTRSDPS